MNILVVNNAVPFTWGGAEELAFNLVQHLNSRRGVQAELLRIPFKWDPKHRIPAEILLNRNFVIQNTDRVVALKFPAYLVQHHKKTIWLLHQFRQAYDLLDDNQSFLSQDEDAQLIDAIRNADNRCFEEAEKIYTNSPVTKSRLSRYNDFDGEVLYPPLNDSGLFRPSEPDGYIFAGGRVDRGKRQDLILEAARLAGPGCRLIVAGPAADKEFAAQLHRFVEDNDLQDRVSLRLRMHTREELAELVSNALACCTLPYREDSLGYVTMEAFACGKPVVTTSDAGGLLEIVSHGNTGYVCQPNAQALGEAFGHLISKPEKTRKMSRECLAVWTAMDLSWGKTIDKLLD